MACGLAKAAVAASYAGLVASLGVEFASAGTLTLVAAGGILLSLGGLIAALTELHTVSSSRDGSTRPTRSMRRSNGCSARRAAWKASSVTEPLADVR